MLKKCFRIVAEGRSVIPEQNVALLPPITQMDKVACIGLNYIKHCKEQNVDLPTNPIIFSKFPSNIIGPYDDIHLPSISDVSL
jgi:2-keto-4-pentenoate hydratase/2-oxohepta-3-ene-1,7-dioic acid hydratase in catechol pathway